MHKPADSVTRQTHHGHPGTGMTHQIVFLDRSTLQAKVRRPAFEHRWQEYPVTAPNELPERLRDATIAITNKVPLRAEALQRLGPQRHLVGDGNGCVTQAFRQFVRRRDRVLLPPVLESGTSDFRLQCGAIQEYNLMRHTGTRMPVVGLPRDRIRRFVHYPCMDPVEWAS